MVSRTKAGFCPAMRTWTVVALAASASILPLVFAADFPYRLRSIE